MDATQVEQLKSAGIEVWENPSNHESGGRIGSAWLFEWRPSNGIWFARPQCGWPSSNDLPLDIDGFLCREGSGIQRDGWTRAFLVENHALATFKVAVEIVMFFKKA